MNHNDQVFIPFASELKTDYTIFRDELVQYNLPHKMDDAIFRQPVNIAPLINDSARMEINVICLN